MDNIKENIESCLVFENNSGELLFSEINNNNSDTETIISERVSLGEIFVGVKSLKETECLIERSHKNKISSFFSKDILP